tara:strand:+ start:3689 stop:4327 length:639 start_codon:yes stop_codon:yes gene_type:complete
MNKQLYLITPVSRKKNLKNLYNSINWEYVTGWIIVYDSKFFKDLPSLFKDNSKIIELINEHPQSVSGNSQRNAALNYLFNKKIDCFIYFLDDDNIIHPNFYNIFNEFKKGKIYTFNQQKKSRSIRLGNDIRLHYIDMAMFSGDFSLIKDIRFKNEIYHADCKYIVDSYNKNKENYIYVDQIGSYYNYLQYNIVRRSFKRLKTYIYYNFIKKK